MDPAPIPVETLLAHREWVGAVARAVVRDPNAADDLEQETWLAALRSPPARTSSLRGWLGAVVRSRARRAGRTASRREARESIAARGEATESAADLAEVADTHRRVVQAVVELAEPYRQTILLRYFEGHPVEDVAARTGVPLDTARSRISRGLAKLRERLERELGTKERPWHLALAPLCAGTRGKAAGAGIGAAAGGTAMATKLAWLGAGVLFVGAIGAVAVSKLTASADDAKPVAAAPPDVRAPAAPPIRRAPAVPVAAARVDDPPPAPAAPAAAPAPAESAQKRLDAAKVDGMWQDVPLLEVMGDLSAQAKVDFFIAAEALEKLGPKPEQKRVTFAMSGVQASMLVGLVVQMQGLDLVVEETRVVIVPAGGRRDETKPLVPIARPGVSAKSPASLAVKGVVVDESGAPLADATIAGAAEGGDRTPLAKSGADGAFEIAVTRPYPSILADVPGRVPSPAFAVTGAYGATAELRLVVGGAAAIVTGHVLDADGRPVEGARVRVATQTSWQSRTDASGFTFHPALPQTVTTEPDGSFRDDTVAPGTLVVTASAAGSERCKVDAEAKPSQTLDLVLRLGRSACWRGTVRDRDGRPIAGATVDAQPGGRTTSAADGTFTVTGLRAGGLRVVVRTPDHRTFERLRSFQGGGDLAWDPVFGSGMRIAGRVVSDVRADDRPVGVACTVLLVPAEPWRPLLATGSFPTQADGSFAFDDVDAGSYRVCAMDVGGAPTVLPMAVSTVVSASREGVEVVVANAGGPKAHVAGRIVGADGKPFPAAGTVDLAETRQQRAFSVDEAGLFRTAALPPGRYRIRVRAKDDLRLLDLGSRAIGVDDVDLGTVTLPPQGRAHVRWTRTGEPAGELRTVIESIAPDGARTSVEEASGPVRAGDGTWQLSPGRYCVRVSGATIQGCERVFDVSAGTDTDVLEIPVVAAPTRVLTLRFPADAPGAARVRITDATGAFVHESDWTGGALNVALAPGHFRFEVSVTATLRMLGVLDVPSDGAPAALDVVLR
jgi:RNA polymerase sigma-70 factor (ECF subfamily)